MVPSHDIMRDRAWKASSHEIAGNPFSSLVAPQSIETPEWRAALVTVPARQLIELRVRYGDALFSANVRDYLGSRQSNPLDLVLAGRARRSPSNVVSYT